MHLSNEYNCLGWSCIFNYIHKLYIFKEHQLHLNMYLYALSAVQKTKQMKLFWPCTNSDDIS